MEEWLSDAVDALHDHAQRLLRESEELENGLNANTGREDAQRRLKGMCDGLSRIIETLDGSSSPLRGLVRRLGGARVSIDRAHVTVERFVREHRGWWIHVGLPERAIDDVVRALDAEAREGEHRLDVPDSLTIDDVLPPLKDFRNLVCELANAGADAASLISPPVIGHVVSGTIGVTMVVVDITGAVGGPAVDPSGWVLVKAVKSVWSGVSRVRRAWGGLKEILDGEARRQLAREEELARVREAARRNPTRFRKDREP